jgi:hypothetical protein
MIKTFVRVFRITAQYCIGKSVVSDELYLGLNELDISRISVNEALGLGVMIEVLGIWAHVH